MVTWGQLYISLHYIVVKHIYLTDAWAAFKKKKSYNECCIQWLRTVKFLHVFSKLIMGMSQPISSVIFSLLKLCIKYNKMHKIVCRITTPVETLSKTIFHLLLIFYHKYVSVSLLQNPSANSGKLSAKFHSLEVVGSLGLHAQWVNLDRIERFLKPCWQIEIST